jgi:hypothetical protein
MGMRAARLWVTLALSSVAFAAACADILGIDDGIPRMDASAFDAPAADVQVGDAMAEAEAAPPFSPLPCGTKTCNVAAGEACCRSDTAAFDCVDAAASCKGTYIPCDRPEQCVSDAGAKQCCTTDVITDAGTYVATSVACVASDQCEPVPTHYVLCGDDSGTECPDATMCGTSVTTLPPFLICK